MFPIPNCVVTDHFMSKKVVGSFAKGINTTPININKFRDFSKPLATYGILRGTGRSISQSKRFLLY